MEILDAYDLVKSYRPAAEQAGCSHHTVARYVAAREAGKPVADRPEPRPQLIDAFLPKVEEWMERSGGRVRADVAHGKLLALGYTGSERTTRRAVARVRKSFKAGRVRVHRPWVTEPGMWLQYDFGDGPLVNGERTVLFCAWLAWSRYRVVLPIRDEAAFLALGPGARLWLTESAAAGTTRMRIKMAEAVSLAKLTDPAQVDRALGQAAVNGRFAEADLAAFLAHAGTARSGPTHAASEERSLAQGTRGWTALGAPPESSR
jgi:hypothetical protein